MVRKPAWTAASRRSPFWPRKFIAFNATKFKHATFVGLPAVILALGAVA
jgi:hypothetical protein